MVFAYRGCPGHVPEVASRSGGEDAWKGIKALYNELREALGEEESSHGQLYVREGGETKAEWEASGRQALLPGLPPPGVHPPQIVIDSTLPDEALEALFEIDFNSKVIRLIGTRVDGNGCRRIAGNGLTGAPTGRSFLASEADCRTAKVPDLTYLSTIFAGAGTSIGRPMQWAETLLAIP